MTEEQYHWFAEDGSYGNGITLIVDTSKWSDEDWRDIEDASDSERVWLALEISKKYK